MKENINKSYEIAKEMYAAYGVDTDKALEKMRDIPISIHCWQGDDLTGFEEDVDGLSDGGILATGNFYGKARNGEELRQDLSKALSLIPGNNRVNIHSIYAETNGKKVERDELTADYFSNWINWAKEKKIGLDFNPTFFSHDMASSGFTLSDTNDDVRNFWIRHAKACREIACEIGKALGTPCVNNLWIQDGAKDLTANRFEYRNRLKESLDDIYKKDMSKDYILDTLEQKLFGIGTESFVVGSHEFYLDYTLLNNIIPCLDMGHYHPTENVSDKISALLNFRDKILLHVSRGVRWDSDHVVIYNDEIISMATEIKRSDAFDKVIYALDFFDASINRVSAWVIGTRAAIRSILFALLEPTHILRQEEAQSNLGNRLAFMEEFKGLPFNAVFDMYCLQQGVPCGSEWIQEVKAYENMVLSKRD